MINKIIKFHFICLAVLLLVVSYTFAAFFCELRFHGFDANGKNLAFSVYDGLEGSSTMVTTYIINVSSNQWTVSPLRMGDEEHVISTDTLKLIKYKLNNFGILDGNIGDHVVARRAAEIAPNPFRAVFVDGGYSGDQSGYGIAPPYYFRYNEKSSAFSTRSFEVLLSTFTIGHGENVELAAFKLSITNLATGKVKILQDDKKLPKSRGEVYQYAIKDIYVYHDVVAVFLAMENRIFEGSGVDYMVVTGTLP